MGNVAVAWLTHCLIPFLLALLEAFSLCGVIMNVLQGEQHFLDGFSNIFPLDIISRANKTTDEKPYFHPQNKLQSFFTL